MALKTLGKKLLVMGLILGGAFVFLWQLGVLRGLAPAWSPTALDTPILVQVVGEDFFWRFRFPGPDREFNTKDDASVEKELHLPAGRDVVFLITSSDYVYTMTIPELGLRQIAVPELTFPLNFRGDEERSYAITTDPLCGVRLLHDDYMGKIIVQSESAFDSWYRGIP